MEFAVTQCLSSSFQELFTMQIKILRLGHSARHHEAAAGATVGEVLDAVDLPAAGHAISVNGLGASTTTGLSDGDVVTLVPKVEGGSK